MNLREEVEKLLKKILIKYPFWGGVLIQSILKIDETLPTFAAMTITEDNKFVLLINPTLFNITDPEIQIKVIIHEIVHYVLLHPLRCKNEPHKLRNISADLEVNSLINMSPGFKTTDGKEGYFLLPEIFNLPREKTIEWYANELKKKAEYNKNNNDNNNSNDKNSNNDSNNSKTDNKNDNSNEDSNNSNSSNSKTNNKNNNFNDSSDDSNSSNSETDNKNNNSNSSQSDTNINKAKKIDEAIEGANENHKKWENFKPIHKELMRKIIEKTTKMAGKVPGNVQQIIDNIYKNKIDWRNELKRAILTGKVRASERTSTWKRPNRRFENQKGYKNLRQPHIVVAVDVSGSVSDKEIEKFFGEINKITQIARQIDLIIFDDIIQKEMKNLKRLPNRVEIKGRGGTNFIRVFEHVEKEYKDNPLLIMLTDGYDDEGKEREKKKFDLIWVIPERGDTKKKWGKVIILPQDENENEN